MPGEPVAGVVSFGRLLAMSYAELQQAIWLVGMGLHAYLVSVVVLRGLYRTLPIFSSYLFFMLAKSLLLWAMHLKRAGAWYYLSYWVGETIAFTLGFMVIVELFSRLLEPHAAVAAFCRSVLAIVFGALVATCLILAQLEGRTFGGTFVLLERSVRYVQVGLIASWFAMAAYFRLAIRPWQRAVALGYGLFAAAELANHALLMYFHYGYENISRLVGPVAYLLALALWSVYLTLPLAAPAGPSPAPSPAFLALEAEIRRRMEEVNRALWAVLRGRQA